MIKRYVFNALMNITSSPVQIQEFGTNPSCLYHTLHYRYGKKFNLPPFPVGMMWNDRQWKDFITEAVSPYMHRCDIKEYTTGTKKKVMEVTDSMKNTHVIVRITEQDKEKLMLLAKAEDMSMSEWIRGQIQIKYALLCAKKEEECR